MGIVTAVREGLRVSLCLPQKAFTKEWLGECAGRQDLGLVAYDTEKIREKDWSI